MCAELFLSVVFFYIVVKRLVGLLDSFRVLSIVVDCAKTNVFHSIHSSWVKNVIHFDLFFNFLQFLNYNDTNYR